MPHTSSFTTCGGTSCPRNGHPNALIGVYGLLLVEVFVGYHLYPDVPKFSLLDLAAFVHAKTYKFGDSIVKAVTESVAKISVALLGGPGLAASVFAQLCPYVIILFLLYHGIARFGKQYFIVSAVVSAVVLLAGAPH